MPKSRGTPTLSPSAMLRAATRRARHLGLPPASAFLGAWAGSRAVIFPSIELTPALPHQVYAALPARSSGEYRVGFVSYPDVVPGDPPPLPQAVAGTTEGVLILGDDGQWSATGNAPDPQELIQTFGTATQNEVAANSTQDRPQDLLPVWKRPDKNSHTSAVRDCLEAIRAGEIYQACLSTRLDGFLSADPVAAFIEISGHAPAAKQALLQGEWGSVLAFSPEEFLVRCGPNVETSPIKGTLPIDHPPEELRSCAKDVAENIMIVDLARHDLGSIAEIGSVQVSELLALRPGPGVHHLASTIRARTTVDNARLLDAMFPPASVTGTPKIRARELINRWEPRSRGLHCGTYGFAHGETLDLAVAIRTMEVLPDGQTAYGVGGGITIDSTPEGEWEECLAKAAFTWGGGAPPWE